MPEVPVSLPRVPGGRHSETFRQIRDAIAALRSRIPHPEGAPRGLTVSPGFHLHTEPVTNGTTTWNCIMKGGQIRALEIHDDSDDDAQFCMVHLDVANTTLTGLADDTTYGIWLKAAVDYSVPVNNNLDSSASTETVFYYALGTPSVVKDSTNTVQGNLGAMTATTAGFAYVYVGKVAIASGVVTITQGLKGSFTWHLPSSLKPYVVSEDTPNNITAGTDGGALYDDPIEDIIGGTGITVTPDTPSTGDYEVKLT